MTHSAPRPRKGDALLIAALLTGLTVTDAAAAAGISRATATRRLTDAGFRETLIAARAQVLSEAPARLLATSEKATKRLTALMEEAVDEGVQMRSAGKLLDLMLRAYQAADMLPRIEELERRIDESNASTTV